MKQILVFIGTRPEGIKMAPVIDALEKSPDMEPLVVSTGQHRELLQHVVDTFGIRVHHDLEVMAPNQGLARLTARLMEKIDALLDEVRPDMALVQGDTTTVMVAALACFYRHIPVGHIEAGLRTGNVQSPFPEEINRRLASSLASLHFPPTTTSRDNLLREGVDPTTITVTGNTVIDALHMEVERQRLPDVQRTIDSNLAKLLGGDWQERPSVLVTGHRRENFGEGFDEICDALSRLAQTFEDHEFIYPVHLNPNVQGPVYERLGDLGNVSLIPPQGYSEFVALMGQSKLIVTDSGGVQEEAPSLGKPVLVMRDTTERQEGIAAGTVILTGAKADNIVREVSELITDEAKYRRMAEAANPYGDGHASERILGRVREFLA